MDGDVVTVEKVIPAPADAIFALLADPARHPDIDGSGAVKQAKADAPQRLALGSTFGMSMRLGIPYSMVNTVIEFEDNRRIAWQARPPGFVGRFSAGRIWRYELEPVEGGHAREGELGPLRGQAAHAAAARGPPRQDPAQHGEDARAHPEADHGPKLTAAP